MQNKITTMNENEFLVVSDSLDNDKIMLTSYNEKTFEGISLWLSKNQTKELIKQLEQRLKGD